MPRNQSYTNSTAILAVLLFCFSVVSGCGNNSPIAGSWTTVDGSIIDGIPFKMNISLTHNSDVVGGTAEIVLKNRGDLPDDPFQLTEMRFDGERLSFVSLTFPKDRDECLILHLKLDKEHLKGTFREIDNAKENAMEIVFRRE